MLVRKDYRSQLQKKKRRKWRLSYLPKEEEESKRKHDLERAAFLFPPFIFIIILNNFYLF